MTRSQQPRLLRVLIIDAFVNHIKQLTQLFLNLEISCFKSSLLQYSIKSETACASQRQSSALSQNKSKSTRCYILYAVFCNIDNPPIIILTADKLLGISFFRKHWLLTAILPYLPKNQDGTYSYLHQKIMPFLPLLDISYLIL